MGWVVSAFLRAVVVCNEKVGKHFLGLEIWSEIDSAFLS